jgi:tRNA A-37 threonylcarbamoyl transferase component Bud32
VIGQPSEPTTLATVCWPAEAAATERDDETDTGARTRSRSRRPSEPLEPGERYELGASLGSGGMGEVNAAYDHQIGREVAIKRLRASRPSHAALARFLREARIQGRLDHPAIAPVHEVGIDDNGRPFFAMKKLVGTTLAVVLRDARLRERFPRSRLLRAFVEVCFAIDFAHARGVIHRDLKPSNVLLGDYGEVFVIDWGVARMRHDGPQQADDITDRGRAVGTPGYMAPEQVVGRHDLDPRVDVYALGCILFEILAGSPLHPYGRAGMRSAVEGHVEKPSNRADDVPPELDELCERAIATDRDARLDSARELGETVQRYLDGDRDAALRKRLAADHLAIARAAAALDDECGRRAAIREAGRALALDPTSNDAAELIGHLIVAPPRVTPAAVAAELADLDRLAAQRQTTVGVAVHVALLAITGLFFAIGMRGGYLGVFAAVTASRVACGLRELHDPRPRNVAINFTLNVVVIAMLARMFTPFLVAPGFAAVTLMAFAFHPAATRKCVLVAAVLLAIAGVAGVWAVEATGLAEPTMHAARGVILLASPVDGIQSLPAEPTLCCFAVVLCVVAALLAAGAARSHREARHRVHLHAWQLAQLVTTSAERGPMG